MIAHTRTTWLNSVTALLAVAVLLVHAVVMGWHVPPRLRALAALDTSVCHSVAPGHSAPDDHPATPSDHLAHCPICLSVDGGKLFGPADGPALPLPTRVSSASLAPAESAVFTARLIKAFSARAPPVAV